MKGKTHVREGEILIQESLHCFFQERAEVLTWFVQDELESQNITQFNSQGQRLVVARHCRCISLHGLVSPPEGRKCSCQNRFQGIVRHQRVCVIGQLQHRTGLMNSSLSPFASQTIKLGPINLATYLITSIELETEFYCTRTHGCEEIFDLDLF